MDRLPQELVDRVSSFLSRESLKNTLLLSHAFRSAAEKYSGAFARFALNKDTAAKFTSTFSGYRLSYLRNLEFGIRLPPPVDSDLRDDANQLRRLDRVFTEQVTFLFETLKVVEEGAGNQSEPGTIRLAISPLWRPIRCESPLSYHDHLSWRIHLLNPGELPSLRSIRSLEIGDKRVARSSCRTTDDVKYRLAEVKLDYRVMVDLVSNLPNLEYWGCRIGGDEWSPKTEQEAAQYLTQDWAGPRRDTRQDFVKALSSVRLPDTLRQVRLDFLYDLDQSTDIDHLTAQPDLTSPAVSDLFSTSLHHLSHHLRRLHLRVVVDETLFWPKNGCNSPWPKLESLVVAFHMVSSSGRWYFNGPNGEGRDTRAYKITDAAYPPLETTSYDEEMDDQIAEEGDRRSRGNINTRIRIVPNDTTLRPFLAAFAKAAAEMKALQEAVLWCPLTWQPEDEDDYEDASEWLPDDNYDMTKLAWGIHYQAVNEPNFTRQGGHVPTKVPLLWWKVGKWRPDPELHELFLQIGHSPGVNDLEEQWEDQDFGGRLVNREYFEYCVQEEVDKVGRILLPH
jgi:hypothetical protein